MLKAKENQDGLLGSGLSMRAANGSAFQLPSWLRRIDPNGLLKEAILSDQDLRFALGSGFVTRLGQWFGRLIVEKQETAFDDQVPDVTLFGSLPRSPFRDDIGKWLWDRFTLTEIKRWSPVSQAYEWNWLANDESHEAPRRVLLERPTSIEAVSTAYFQSMLSRSLPSTLSGFDATEFAREAAQRLQAGKAREAAEIFAGITELRPTDFEAWNNLGFCLLSLDPEAALHAFGRSAMYSGKRNHLQLANHLLALHLLGRDEDALVLAEEEVIPYEKMVGAWVWNHSVRGNAGNLTYVDDVVGYLADLMDHISGQHCQNA